MDELRLLVDVVRLDDAFQKGIGDWLEPSGTFSSLDGMVGRVLDRRRRAGIWTAPFIAGSKSDLFRDHQDWLVRDGNGDPRLAQHTGNRTASPLIRHTLE